MAKATTTTTTTTLNTLPFTLAVKSRGSASATGDSATYNSTNRRLTLGAFYYRAGYRSGAIGITEDGKIAVVLSKEQYNSTYSALHSTQYFITAVKGSPAVQELAKSRHYTITRDEKNADILYLVPKK